MLNTTPNLAVNISPQSAKNTYFLSNVPTDSFDSKKAENLVLVGSSDESKVDEFLLALEWTNADEYITLKTKKSTSTGKFEFEHNPSELIERSKTEGKTVFVGVVFSPLIEGKTILISDFSNDGFDSMADFIFNIEGKDYGILKNRRGPLGKATREEIFNMYL